MFISFEGIDGCGKTTQVELLKKEFSNRGLEFISVREPGSTAISEQIRQILLNPDNTEINPETEALLFASARAQIVKETIKPALLEDKIVICDRFIDSTIVYQGYGRGMELNSLENINSFAIQNTIPDFTFIIDISVVESQIRLSPSNLDRMETIGTEFFKNVRNGYLQIANQNPKRVHILDGMDSIEEIQSKIVELIF